MARAPYIVRHALCGQTGRPANNSTNRQTRSRGIPFTSVTVAGGNLPTIHTWLVKVSWLTEGVGNDVVRIWVDDPDKARVRV